MTANMRPPSEETSRMGGLAGRRREPSSSRFSWPRLHEKVFLCFVRVISLESSDDSFAIVQSLQLSDGELELHRVRLRRVRMSFRRHFERRSRKSSWISNIDTGECLVEISVFPSPVFKV